ncbi:MAG: lysylphosphatidylglycerol synthase transmembrane domain-containing protein [Candidatus Bathyarchaeia archaeon]
MEIGSSAKLSLFIGVGVLVFALYLYFFVGFNDIIEVFRLVDPSKYLIYYSVAIIAMLLSMLFYSMSWNSLLKALSINVGLKKAFIYCWLGIFVDLVVPLETISGEVTRIYLVHKETGDSSGRIVASVLVHRIITTIITLGSLIFASFLFLLKYEISFEVVYLLLTVLSGSIIMIVSLVYLSLKKEAAERLIDLPLRLIAFIVRGRLNIMNIKERVQRNLIHFHSGFKSFGKKRGALACSITYGIMAWLFHMSIFILVFYALGFYEISTKISETIVVYSLSMALQSIPVALPLGLVEIVMTNLYTLFSIPLALSGIATLLIRVVTFWLQIIIGYAIAQWIGVKSLLSRDPKET